MSRSVKAVPRLIAEGFAKKHQKLGFQKYLADAMAESNETQVGLCQCKDIYPQFVNISLCDDLTKEYEIIGKQLFRLEEAWHKFSKDRSPMTKNQTGSRDQRPLTNQRGQTLMELLLALGLFAFIMTGVFALVFGGLTTGLRGEEQDYATMFAQEGLDAARSIRDNNWDTFISANDAPNTHGVSTKNGKWEWKNASNKDTNDATGDISRNELTQGPRKYIREITVESVGRTASNDIFTGTNSIPPYDFNSPSGYLCEGVTCPSTNADVADGVGKLRRSGAIIGSTTPTEITPATGVKGLWHMNEAVLEAVSPAVTTFSNAGGGSWPYRNSIVIKGSASSLTNYQMLFIINTASLIADGKMKSDGSDIRFTNLSGTELSYWIESGINTPSTNIWVKLDNIAASPTKTTVYEYYGNNNATSSSNGNNVFEFFDDFTGSTINTAKWTETDSASNYITQNNSINIANGTGAWGTTALMSNGTFARGSKELRYKFKPSCTVGASYRATTMIGWQNSTGGSGYATMPHAMYFYRTTTAGTENINIYETGNSRGGTGAFVCGTQYWGKISLKAIGADYYISTDGINWTLRYTGTTYNDTPMKVGFTHYQGGSNDFDNVFIRQYASSEPVVITADSSGNGNDGILQSGLFFTSSGKFSNALSFDGTDDYVSVGNESNFDYDRTQPFSLEAWIKTSSVSEKIMSKMNNASPYTGYELDINNTGVLHTYLISDWAAVPAKALEVTGSISVNNNAWHHVALTYDGSSSAGGLKLYVDGVLDPSITIVKNNLTAPNSILNNINLAIGSRNGQTAYFNGSIDEVAIYNTALDGPTIAAHAGKILSYVTNQPQTIQTPGNTVNDLGSFKDFTETATLPSGTSIDYQISTDGCATMQYWDGNNWTTAGGWTDVRTINRYFSFLNINSAKNLCIKARLNTTDPNQTPSLDNIAINYNQSGGTDDIHTKKITSRVKWNNGFSLQDVSLSEYLTDWMYLEFKTDTESEFNAAGSSGAGLTVDANGTVYITTPTSGTPVNYTSTPIDTGTTSQIVKALWNITNMPAGTSMALKVRSAPDSSGTTWTSWSSQYSMTTGGGSAAIAGVANNRWIQYEITFDPGATATTPVLDKITIQTKTLY